jgi:GT2 family glycosyltransferase
MLISVCVGTVRSETLPATIAAIERQDWADWELILVPQGSDKELLRVCRLAESAKVRTVHLASKGLSRAKNAGASAARGDVIAYTDDDCEPRVDWLTTIAAAFRADAELDMVGGAVAAPPRRTLRFDTCPAIWPSESTYHPIEGRRGAPRGWDWIGANFAIRRAVFDRIGPFDESLGAGAMFPAGEDTDYKLRMEAAGLKMLTTPRAIVDHTFGARSGLNARLRFSKSYATGNGALAGKLALANDPRAEEWVEYTRSRCSEPVKRGRFDQSLLALLRYKHFMQAYRQCLREFAFDPATQCLVPRPQPRGTQLGSVPGSPPI